MAVCKIQSRAPSIVPEEERLTCIPVFLLVLVVPAAVSSCCSGWYVRTSLYVVVVYGTYTRALYKGNYGVVMWYTCDICTGEVCVITVVVVAYSGVVVAVLWWWKNINRSWKIFKSFEVVLR